MKKQTRSEFLKTTLVGVTGMALLPGAGRAQDAGKTSTLDNLRNAYEGEMNRQTRFAAYAKKADEEGYTQVASLFRAAAKAEEINTKELAKVIKKMGGTASANVKTPDVKSTKENIEDSIKGETADYEILYPKFISQARGEGNKDAVRAFNYSKSAEKGHVELFTDVLANLDKWKGGTKTIYVCTVCGHTTLTLPDEKCPVCDESKDKFAAVT